MNFSIKHWPEQERPRERLIKQGPTSLSDAELLAIFLRSGSQHYSAVELARLLIQHFGNLTQILDAPLEQLCQFHGLGPTKYAQLMAVKELGKRYVSEHLTQHELALNQSAHLIDYLKYELFSETREVFALLALDNHLKKIKFEKLFLGSIHHCSISMNPIIRFAIQHHASYLVLTHNHPQGQAQPSEADVKTTVEIEKACQLIEVPLIDHIIITKSGHYSFAEHGLMTTTQR